MRAALLSCAYTVIRRTMKVYTPEELAKGNGEGENQTLVAVDGKVYDVSASKRWIKGRHMNRHQAGCDLTGDISAAPHSPEVLQRFETVGEFSPATKEPSTGLRATVDAFLEHYPFFHRHPHPAAVHIPVGMIMGAILFEFLALVSGSEKTEWAAFCCLALVVVSLPVAMTTGYFTWWINYECTGSPVLNWKRRLAWTSLPLGVVAVVLRLNMVNPLHLGDGLNLVYVICLAALAVMISLIGFLGGKLTFPYD